MNLPSPADARASRGASPWLQRQLTLETGTDVRRCHGSLVAATRSAREEGLLGEWFFVHKPPGSSTHPPGLRLRFCPSTPARAVELDQHLGSALAGGAVAWTRGIYEPEHLLFGGSSSMAHVHAMFCADSAFWAEVHSHEEGFPTWVLAMAQQRAMLRSLHIVGWEDLGVYGWLRDHAHRRTTRVDERLTRASEAVRELWDARDLEASLPAWTTAPLSSWQESFDHCAQAWTSQYLCSEDAVIGARQLAATLIVFSWNRALVSTRYQCIIASSLSDVAARFGLAG